MIRPEEERSDRNHRRSRSPTDSDRRRRAREEDYRDSYRGSQSDSRRRRSSKSPTRTSSRRDRDSRHRESDSRHKDYDSRHRERERERDERRRRHHDDSRHDDDKERSSRRRRSTSRTRTGRSSPQPLQRSGRPLPSQADAFTTEVTKSGSGEISTDGNLPTEKEKPNYGNTGRLAAESNTVAVHGGGTVVLKYHEPPEARKPPAKEAWRLYVFKGQDLLEVVELGERSCWLIGRERLVVDFPLDHPSCSKQHAALQFRFVEKKNEYGDRIGKVKPYLIDLESANGSSLNGDKVPGGRYLELKDKDVLRFGLSSREYVLMLPNE